jgi:hypothetical protein
MENKYIDKDKNLSDLSSYDSDSNENFSDDISDNSDEDFDECNYSIKKSNNLNNIIDNTLQDGDKSDTENISNSDNDSDIEIKSDAYDSDSDSNKNEDIKEVDIIDDSEQDSSLLIFL